MKQIELSIVIPVRNEGGNVAEMARRTDAAMQAAGISYEAIFVVDPSKDDTAEKVAALAKQYPAIVAHTKVGKTGKAYSILEGVEKAKSDWVCMIDGDLQYPPEAIAQMFAMRGKFGVVVANRQSHKTNVIRRLFSRINTLISNRIILGLKDIDTQSGLKLFRKELMQLVEKSNVSEWTLDAPLLYTALDMGFELGSVDIEFAKRLSGKAQNNILLATPEIVFGALKLRLSRNKIYHLPPHKENSMIGAGIAYKRKKFITHSTLPAHHSALVTANNWQLLTIVAVASFMVFAAVVNFTGTLIVVIAFLSLLYFIDVFFSMFLVLKSLHFPPELAFSDEEIAQVKDEDLPIYSILCPLYREASVLGQFVGNIERLDYPKNKLDVLLLLEENDDETIEAANKLIKPDYLRVIIVPNSQPKTKPKACNYGLSMALGEYLVVYDAEDQPEAKQLKKAVLGFRKLGERVHCLQAKLNYYNPHYNLLTRLFTAEYSLWFDLVLPALQSIDTAIPLGGTSNHFRRKDLLAVHGWDAFNVTEDCDLGVRLFKDGKRTAIIDSVTLEEANSNIFNWIRQRSRWIKGYFQTYLVQMRDPIGLAKDFGWHALIFQLVIGARTVFILINPILWLATLSYFLLYGLVGPTIKALYPAPVFYIAVLSLVLGNFLYLYNYMIGCAKRGQWQIIKYVFLVPFYWLFVSLAATKAFVQLIAKPHYWEKTNHGLHLGATQPASAGKKEAAAANLLTKFKINNLVAAGGFLIIVSILGNFFSFLYNAYLGRVVAIEEFGLVTLIGSFIYVAQIFLGAVFRATTHRTAFLSGKTGQVATPFWQFMRRRMTLFSLVIAFGWVALSPLMADFFNANSIWPFLLFAPVWVVGTVSSVDRGFLNGNLKFGYIAAIGLLEAIVKFAVTIALVLLGLSQWVYAAVPISMAFSFLVGWRMAQFTGRNAGSDDMDDATMRNFSARFLTSSMLLNLTSVGFLSLDLILIKHYLSPTVAGSYAFLSLIGTMVYLFGSLGTQFVNPLVSKYEGAGQGSKKVFRIFLTSTVIFSFASFVVLGLFSSLTVPILWGAKANYILPYLPAYTLSMALFAIATMVVSYNQVRERHIFVIENLLFSALEIGLIILFHDSIRTVSLIVLACSAGLLLTTLALHATYDLLIGLSANMADLLGLMQKIPRLPEQRQTEKERILIFNWRDTRHVWAGGAEVYVQEIGKRLVRDGHQVTIFCGNDGKCPRHEVIDGVSIIRRGGFYLVYVWAMLYYVLKLRGKFDVVIDCENGVPFFTPLFVRVKKYLLIHAVNQEIFRKSLPLPFYALAAFLEKEVMPLFYRNIPIITVSPSSKSEILRHNLTNLEPAVVYNGIDLAKFKPGKKNDKPLVVYVGRIKDHKSLPVFVQTANLLLKSYPDTEFVIAGDGPDKKAVVELVTKLKLTDKIIFTGHISEEEKINLYQRAWAFVNPSLMEGWGVTSIEANACGTPVVASNVPGLRDSVHNPHSGFLVPYGDAEAFATQLGELLSNVKLRKRMSKEALSWAKNFSWDKSAKQILELIRKN